MNAPRDLQVAAAQVVEQERSALGVNKPAVAAALSPAATRAAEDLFDGKVIGPPGLRFNLADILQEDEEGDADLRARIVTANAAALDDIQLEVRKHARQSIARYLTEHPIGAKLVEHYELAVEDAGEREYEAAV